MYDLLVVVCSLQVTSDFLENLTAEFISNEIEVMLPSSRVRSRKASITYGECVYK